MKVNNQFQIQNIISKLPNIDTAGMDEVMNIIQQSKTFQNPQNRTLPTNDFELSYASYIATGNEDFLNYYLTILTEACHAEFFEWYEYITKHILEKEVQDGIGISFDPDHHDWVTEFKSSELIGWAYQMPGVDVFLENIGNVDKIGKLMVSFFNEDRRSASDVSITDPDYFESDHARLVLDSVSTILLNNDMQELKNQANSNKILCMIETYGWDNRFNPILLGWICDNRERIKEWG